MTHGIPPEKVESIAERLARTFLAEGLEELDLEFGEIHVSVTRKPDRFVVFGEWRLEYENDPVGQEG